MAKQWQRAGLIVNPVAGGGASESLHAARRVIERAGVHEVFTGAGNTGEAALAGWPGRTATRRSEGVAVNPTRALARWLASQALDVIFVVGGDGTLSDAAMEISTKAPIFGIGTGSTNAGRLITCRASRVGEVNFSALETWNADALLASVNDVLLGMAFNDVVISSTIVGTVNGTACDISSSRRMAGEVVRASPKPVGTRSTKVTRVGPGGEILVAEGESIGTVLAGFAEPSFLGKAITGGICLASCAGLPAGCVVCDSPLAQIGMTAEQLKNCAPMTSKYVSLADDMSIVVEGVEEGATVCVDGNPLHLLSRADRTAITVRSLAAIGVRQRGEARPV